MARVSQKRDFDGRCEECGDIAERRDARGTALLENQQSHVLSSVGCFLIVGPYCGHAYYMLDWNSQVEDPFAPEETSAIADSEPRIDQELPPPPPPKEDA